MQASTFPGSRSASTATSRRFEGIGMARVAVVGSGFIGRAWAITFARAGHDVALWDEDPQAPRQAIDFIASVAPDLAANDLLDGSRPEDLLARLRVERKLGAALADTDHVQESVPERLDVKGQFSPSSIARRRKAQCSPVPVPPSCHRVSPSTCSTGIAAWSFTRSIRLI